MLPAPPRPRKTSPAPLVRARDVEAPIRAVAPLGSADRRRASSLAVAAAMALAVGGSAALVGCGSEAPRREESRTHRDRSARPEQRDQRDGAREELSAFDQLVNAVGDMVDPPAKRPETKVVVPVEPVKDVPRPAGTMAPIHSAPRPAGSAAGPVTPPKTKPSAPRS